MSSPVAPASACAPPPPPLCFAAAPPAALHRATLLPPSATSRAPATRVSTGSFVAPLARRRLLGARSGRATPPSPALAAQQLQQQQQQQRQRGVAFPPAADRRPLAPTPTAVRTSAVGDANNGRRPRPGNDVGAGAAAGSAWKRAPLAGVPPRAAADASGATRRPEVSITAPAWNKRGISSAILIRASLPTVWSALTDYSRLSTFIPNLAYSKQRYHPSGGIRLEQWGVQRIVGFQFKAAVVLDMTEVGPNDPKERAIDFELASSRDFAAFFGTWRMSTVEGGGTWLEYNVNIQPKGLVPVKAVEWRIKEDVPSNLLAVRSYCELLDRRNMATDLRLASGEPTTPSSQADA